MTGEGISNTKVTIKKKVEDKYSKIPVFGKPSDGIVTLKQVEEIQQQPYSKEPVEPESRVEKEGPRYNYIGYEQAYSLDDSQSYSSVEMLKKLALDAFRAKNYYGAMQYFNKILVKNPGNKEALFFKKKVLKKLEDLKKDAV